MTGNLLRAAFGLPEDEPEPTDYGAWAGVIALRLVYLAILAVVFWEGGRWLGRVLE